MKRLNAAFVGVESHFVYTRSSHFLIEELRSHVGKLHVFTSDWKWIHLPRKKHWDLLVFFQHFPQRWELDCLDVDSVVLVPMLDDCPKEKEFWEVYKDCKVLCFSRTLQELILGFGLHAIFARYYPPVPSMGANWQEPGLRAFFWPRKTDLNWSYVRPLMAGVEWKRIHIHQTDKLSVVPVGLSEAEKVNLPVTTSHWFGSAQQYKNILRDCNVFLASRRYEGIGHSFLEALSLGMAVAAPNNPTMNEYIQTGESGFLYDPDNPLPPDWKDARKWGQAARQMCIEGRAAWQASISPP